MQDKAVPVAIPPLEQGVEPKSSNTFLLDTFLLEWMLVLFFSS